MASSPFSNRRLLNSATDTTVVVGYLAALNKSVESFRVLRERQGTSMSCSVDRRDRRVRSVPKSSWGCGSALQVSVRRFLRLLCGNLAPSPKTVGPLLPHHHPIPLEQQNLPFNAVKMADQLKEIADIPQEFLKDGMQFINRCTKPDKREFIKISQGASFALLC